MTDLKTQYLATTVTDLIDFFTVHSARDGILSDVVFRFFSHNENFKLNFEKLTFNFTSGANFSSKSGEIF